MSPEEREMPPIDPEPAPFVIGEATIDWVAQIAEDRLATPAVAKAVTGNDDLSGAAMELAEDALRHFRGEGLTAAEAPAAIEAWIAARVAGEGRRTVTAREGDIFVGNDGEQVVIDYGDCGEEGECRCTLLTLQEANTLLRLLVRALVPRDERYPEIG